MIRWAGDTEVTVERVDSDGRTHRDTTTGLGPVGAVAAAQQQKRHPLALVVRVRVDGAVEWMWSRPSADAGWIGGRV